MIPDMNAIAKLAEEQQRGKVWLEFACAYATSINNGANSEWVSKNADAMVIEYNKRFLPNE